MKKLQAIILASLFLFTNSAFAEQDTVVTNTSFDVPSVFDIAFYSDPATIRYGDGQIVFPAYDPASNMTMVLTSGWADNDGKSDVGVVVRTNIDKDWALKIRLSSATEGFQDTNLAIYEPDRVYNRNYTGAASERNTGITKQWYISSTTDKTIYTGTGSDRNTAPFGMLAPFSFAVLPTGKAMPSGQSQIGYGNILGAKIYSFAVTYTATTTL